MVTSVPVISKDTVSPSVSEGRARRRRLNVTNLLEPHAHAVESRRMRFVCWPRARRRWPCRFSRELTWIKMGERG